MIAGRFSIQPRERRKFRLDYSRRIKKIAEDINLTTVEQVFIEPITSPPLNVETQVDTFANHVHMYVDTAEDGTEYKVELLVNTSDNGVRWEDEVYIVGEAV